MVSRPEPLTKAHKLDRFDCGKEPLTAWLKKYALQNQEAQHTKTMVIAEVYKTEAPRKARSISSVFSANSLATSPEIMPSE